MQTLKLTSTVESDGSLRLQLPAEFANQDVEITLTYAPSPSSTSSSPDEDPLIGLFAGSPELATQSEAILHQEIKGQSGWTWKP